MSAAADRSLVVVTPVYEDAEACGRLFRELAAVFDSKAYLIAVDDGSIQQPLSPAVIADAGIDGVVIKLKRNVGHQRAIAIGLDYLAEHLLAEDRDGAQRIVVMDSDGEDTPQSIVALLQPLQSEQVDIAVAQRKRRVETLRFRAFYVAYKWLFQLSTGRAIDFGNFMAMKPVAVKRLAAMQELSIHVAACVLTSKLRIAECPLDRGPRFAGHSRMNFVGLILHGFKALMVFAEDVLVRVGIACMLIALLSVIGVATAIALKLFGFATPGWFSVALGIMLLVFMQTGTLALMTLLLTGVMRSGSATTVRYDDFIDAVLPARTNQAAR